MRKKRVKKENKKGSFWCASCLDVIFTKWSVFFFTLFLVTIFPQLASQNWKWAFLIIALLLGIKPLRSFLKR